MFNACKALNMERFAGRPANRELIFGQDGQ